MILLLRFLYSFSFDREDISNTRDSVSSAIQTPRISSKILRCASYFQLSSRCLDVPMKHGLSCLIYHINNDQTGFLKGRFIGENIRLINSVIDYAEKQNIPGLLLFVNFEKEFDTLEWTFVLRRRKTSFCKNVRT